MINLTFENDTRDHWIVIKGSNQYDLWNMLGDCNTGMFKNDDWTKFKETLKKHHVAFTESEVKMVKRTHEDYNGN